MGKSRAQPLSSWFFEGMNLMDFSLRKCRFGVFLCPSTQFRVWQGVLRNSLIDSFLRHLLRIYHVLSSRERVWGRLLPPERSWKMNMLSFVKLEMCLLASFLPSTTPHSLPLDIWRGEIKGGFYDPRLMSSQLLLLYVICMRGGSGDPSCKVIEQEGLSREFSLGLWIWGRRQIQAPHPLFPKV